MSSVAMVMFHCNGTVRELLDQKKVEDYLKVFFNYISQATDKVTNEDIKEAIQELPELEEYMPTLAEQWMKEGKKMDLLFAGASNLQ